jgi:hypothetical protein
MSGKPSTSPDGDKPASSITRAWCVTQSHPGAVEIRIAGIDSVTFNLNLPPESSGLTPGGQYTKL